MGLKSGLSALVLTAMMLCGCAAQAHKEGASTMLDDRTAITDVLIRYATAIDARDWKMFGTCFTEDVLLDYDSGIGTYKGRDVFTKRFDEGHAKLGPTMHKMSNFVITVDGDKATAKSYVDALLMPLVPGGNYRTANGFYEDKLVREKDGWKISHRKFTTVQILDIPAAKKDTASVSVDEQTRIATDFLTNIGKGGIDRKYYADDMVAWSSAMGFVKLPDYLPKLDIVQKVFTKPLEMKIDTTTAQPGRVVLQSRSHGVLWNGETYTNENLFLFEFNDKGQIKHIREYFNMDRLRNILMPAIAKWREVHEKKAS